MKYIIIAMLFTQPLLAAAPVQNYSNGSSDQHMQKEEEYFTDKESENYQERMKEGHYPERMEERRGSENLTEPFEVKPLKNEDKYPENRSTDD